MSDKPFFPPPQKKDAYRDPAPRPIESPEPAEPERKPIVVTRATEEDAPLTREEKAGDLVSAARSERGFWERNSFWANYPRTTGAVLVVVGGLLSVPLLAGGPRGWTRGSTFGVFLFVTGFWSLVAGYPVQTDGRFPRWWGIGLLCCYAAGAIISIAAMVGR